MKKIKFIPGTIALSLVTLFTAMQANAQKGGGSGNSFEEGTVTVSIGAGLGRGTYDDYGYYSSGYYGYGTAIGAKAVLERGMWQLGPGVLSLGVEFGGSFATASYDGYKSNILIAAVRAAYHFGWNVDKLDTYGGVSVGPGLRTNSYYDNVNLDKYTRHSVTVAPGIFVGGTYFFSENIGVNVELGYDITEVQGGIIFKLK